jgi:hypothetical protein
MLTRRGFLGTLTAVAVAPRLEFARPSQKPHAPATQEMEHLEIRESFDDPATMTFTAKRGAFRLGQAVTFAIGADMIFSGLVRRIDHQPGGDHIFAEDPTPIHFDQRWRELYGV